MRKLLALIGAAAAIVVAAPAASAGQVLVGTVPGPNGSTCNVYQNTNTGVFHTKCR